MRALKVVWWLIAVATALAFLGAWGNVATMGRAWGVGAPFILLAGLVARGIRRVRSAREESDRRRRPSKDRIPTSIAALFELPAGLEEDAGLQVRVEGLLSAKKDLKAPWSGRPCAGYCLTVDLLNPADMKEETPRGIEVLRESKVTESSLKKDGRSVTVAADAELELAETNAAIVPWKNLEDQSRDLFRRVDAACSLRGINRKSYTGVRIEEGVLESGSRVEVHGTCTRTSSGVLILRRKETEDDALVVSTLFHEARAKRLKKRIRDQAKAGFIEKALAAILAAWIAYAWVNPSQRGTISYRAFPAKGRIELHGGIGEPPTTTWAVELRPPGVTDVRMEIDHEPATPGRRDTLRLFATNDDAPARYRVGRDPALAWNGSRWVFELRDPLPPTATVTEQRGEIRVKNMTRARVKLLFDAVQKQKAPSTTDEWTFEPWEASDQLRGIRLSTSGVPILVSTGDRLRLFVATSSSARGPYEPMREYLLGSASSLKWFPERGWMFEIREDDLVSRRAQISIRNPTAFVYRVDVKDPEDNAVGTWIFEPGDGADSAIGNNLVNGDEKILVREDFRVEISRRRERALCSGPLGECAFARFDPERMHWTIDVR